MPSERESPVEPEKADDRRRNFELRERLDEMIQVARELSRSRDELSEEELEKMRQRIDWLAEEIWQSAAYGPLEERE